MSFSVLGSNQGHPISIDVSKGSSYLWLQHPKFLHLPLFLMTLKVMRGADQIFCRMPRCDLSAAFLVMRLECEFWGQKPRRWSVILTVPHEVYICYHHDLPPLMLTSVSWLMQCFSTVLTFSFSLLPYCALWYKVTMHRPLLRNREFCYTNHLK